MLPGCASRAGASKRPTEAMITLPHQRWRKDALELLVELQPPDEQGRTIAWIQVAPLVPVTPTTTNTLTTPPLMAVAISPQNAAPVVELARLDEGQPVWVGPWSPDG